MSKVQIAKQSVIDSLVANTSMTEDQCKDILNKSLAERDEAMTRIGELDAQIAQFENDRSAWEQKLDAINASISKTFDEIDQPDNEETPAVAG